MKQDAKNKLIFVAGSIFGLVVLGALVQVVGAQYQWAPPNETFPNANTAPPIDISATGQKKTGNISIEVGTGQSAITVSNNAYVGTPNSRIIFGAGTGDIIRIYGGGLALPIGTGTGGEEGLVRYNNSSGVKKVQFNDGTNWKDVGTGSGSSYWTPSSGGIAYTGGNVTITKTTQGTQTGFWATGEIGHAGKENNISLLPRAHAEEVGSPKALACDTNDFYRQCPDFFSGGYKDGSAVNEGSIGYDRFAECPVWNNLQGDLNTSSGKCNYYTSDFESTPVLQHTGNPTYRKAMYNYETRNVGNPSDTAMLTVGNISVGGTSNIKKAKISEFDFSDIKSVTKGGLNVGFHDMGVKGLVVSFTVNTGGSPDQATSFKIFDSMDMPIFMGGGAGGSKTGGYTFFDRNGDVAVGLNNIHIVIPPDPGGKQFIDSITIKYIPLSQ